MKRRLLWWLIPVILVLFAVSCWYARKEEAQRAVFSWSSDVLAGPAKDAFFQTMEALSMNVVYQSVSRDAELETVQAFLKEADQRNISVWFLTGIPAWGLDPDGKEMAAEVARMLRYQRGLKQSEQFAGMMMDCEAYLADDWAGDDEAAEIWASALINARGRANREHVEFGICIPYYLDDQGYTNALYKMIHNGCDTLAIMNYYKEKEAEHIQYEVNLARDAQKPVMVVYELQEPGDHGLREVNTYYDDGLDAVEASWNALKRYFAYDGLHIAFHEYDALQEVAEYE